MAKKVAKAAAAKAAKVVKKAAPAKKAAPDKKAAPAKKAAAVKTVSYLCNMRIGADDKARIQKEAAKAKMTFQQFAVEAVKRRLAGQAPVKKVARKQLKNFDSVITCRFTAAQRKKVSAAAKAKKITVTELVLGAVFGTY